MENQINAPEMTTLSLINLMPYTKEQRIRFIDLAKNEILAGDFEVAKIAVILKSAIETLSALYNDKDIKDEIINELRGEKSRNFSTANCELSISERKTYSFENDSEWVELNNQIEVLKEKQKSREKLLKSLKEPLADVNTGEVINPAILKQATEIITIRFK